jgi:small subunit ribosomal protein S17
MPKRVIKGKVIKISGEKTFSLLVERNVLHPRYHKYVKKTKKYLVHDEKLEVKLGDTISAVECPPISKSKTFRLDKILTTGAMQETHDDNADNLAKGAE